MVSCLYLELGKHEHWDVEDYLHDNENQLHHWKYNFYSRIAVHIAHITGDFEDVHDNTEDSEDQQTS